MSGFCIELVDSSGAQCVADVSLIRTFTGEIAWRAILWSKDRPNRSIDGCSSDAGAVEDDIRRIAADFG